MALHRYREVQLPVRATPATLDVLSVLLSSGTAYAFQIGKAIERKSGAVTPILRRLEDHGWLTGTWDNDEDRPGPRRRWYRITPGYEEKVRSILTTRDHPMLPPVA